MSTSIAARAANPDWKQQFAKVSDEYFDQVYFHYAPSTGTMVGLHQYDAQLEDFSRPAIDAEIAALKSFEQQIEAIVPEDSRADFVPRTDREMVLDNIRSQLLTLETIRPWEKNADTYSSTCANARLRLDGAQIRASQRPPALARRPRKTDASSARRRARQSPEPAAHLH